MQRRVLGLLYRTWHSFISFQRSGEVGTRPAGLRDSSRMDCRHGAREPKHELLGSRPHPSRRSISALLLRLQLRKNHMAIGLATTPTLDPADPAYHWTDYGIVVQ